MQMPINKLVLMSYCKSFLQINLYALYIFELNTSMDNTSKYSALIKK